MLRRFFSCLMAGLALAAWGPARAQDGAWGPQAGDQARTRYPIVLAHGLSGFSSLGRLDYWYGIVQDLRAHGATVFVTQVSAFNASEVRGEQLLRQVEQIVASTGAGKVHLIGHSHGSHSARYVAGLRPDLVASVTSVSGPNQGSAVADSLHALSRFFGPFLTHLVAEGFDLAGWWISAGSGRARPQDAYAAMLSLTSEGAARFNRRFPAGVPLAPCGDGEAEVAGVRYYSWSGVGQFYRFGSPVDYLMVLTSFAFDGQANDGLVGRCSSHLGQVLGDAHPMNHFHAVNQPLGRVGAQADPVALYRTHAARLRRAGL